MYRYSKTTQSKGAAWAGNKLRLVLVSFGVLLLAGCAKDFAALQITAYVNQDILNIAELEQYALAQYAAVTGKNYASDQAVSKTLRESVIPYYGRFVDELRAIQPQNDELKNLHGIYYQGADLLYRGFKMKLAGIEAQDALIIRSANQQITAGRLKTEQWRQELLLLYRKYDVAQK